MSEMTCRAIPRTKAPRCSGALRSSSRTARRVRTRVSCAASSAASMSPRACTAMIRRPCQSRPISSGDNRRSGRIMLLPPRVFFHVGFDPRATGPSELMLPPSGKGSSSDFSRKRTGDATGLIEGIAKTWLRHGQEQRNKKDARERNTPMARVPGGSAGGGRNAVVSNRYIPAAIRYHGSRRESHACQ